MDSNVFLISLIGITIVFGFLFFLFGLLKFFKYIFISRNLKNEMNKKIRKAKKEDKKIEEEIAVVFTVLSQDLSSSEIVSIKKRR